MFSEHKTTAQTRINVAKRYKQRQTVYTIKYLAYYNYRWQNARKSVVAGTSYMEFESMKLLLRNQDMEEVRVPGSSDLFNIFCKKDGEPINIIQAIESQDNSRELSILPVAALLLQREIENHRRQHLEMNVSVIEEVAEVAFNTSF